VTNPLSWSQCVCCRLGSDLRFRGEGDIVSRWVQGGGQVPASIEVDHVHHQILVDLCLRNWWKGSERAFLSRTFLWQVEGGGCGVPNILIKMSETIPCGTAIIFVHHMVELRWQGRPFVLPASSRKTQSYGNHHL